eukprot:2013173-Amphidinium_carterae.1
MSGLGVLGCLATEGSGNCWHRATTGGLKGRGRHFPTVKHHKAREHGDCGCGVGVGCAESAVRH